MQKGVDSSDSEWGGYQRSPDPQCTMQQHGDSEGLLSASQAVGCDAAEMCGADGGRGHLCLQLVWEEVGQALTQAAQGGCGVSVPEGV